MRRLDAHHITSVLLRICIMDLPTLRTIPFLHGNGLWNVWNALSPHLRSSSISRGQFRAGLKTHLHTGLRTPLRTFIEECIVLHLHLHYMLAQEWTRRHGQRAGLRPARLRTDKETDKVKTYCSLRCRGINSTLYNCIVKFI